MNKKHRNTWNKMKMKNKQYIKSRSNKIKINIKQIVINKTKMPGEVKIIF